jgi:hypothetical protein
MRSSARLADVIVGRKQASADAQAQHLADVAHAANFDDLLGAAKVAEQEFRTAQAAGRPLAEQYPLAKKLDAALTDVMRSGFAAVQAEIGPRGYDDRIFKRKAMATPVVHALNTEAERLLTLRETHRLTGIPPLPGGVGLSPDHAGSHTPH